MQENIGQTVVIDNRGAVGGILGFEMGAKAVPDGHTILLAVNSGFTINPHVFKKLPYDPMRELQPITQLTTVGNVVVVHPSVKASNIRDFVALATRARNDIAEIRPLLGEALDDETRARLLAALSSPYGRLDDALWVRIVYGFLAASHRGRSGLDDLAKIFVPLYLWRAAGFMADTAAEDESAMQRRLDMLCETFKESRPFLVDQWMAGGVRSS